MLIRPIQYSDPDCCNCGSCNPVAVLEAEGVQITLCYECLDELQDSLIEFSNTVFCHQCENFKMRPEGWSYGGTCCCRSENGTLTRDVDCMGSCQYAVRSNNIRRRTI